jgi:hypothetical protein
MEAAVAVKQSCEANLIKKRNVQGVGIGFKWVNGEPTDEPAILVFVEKKYTKSDCYRKQSLEDFIPPSIDGVRTDVIEVGKIIPHSYTSKCRPIQPGFSAGHVNVTAGTIGGFFRDQDGDVVALSNNHVFADENRCQIGDIIYQPGRADSGVSAAPQPVWGTDPTALPYFATLKKWSVLSAENTHDSATAKVHENFMPSMINPVYPHMNGRMVGVRDAASKMVAQKVGRTTGYTSGKVMGVKASFTIGYDTIEAKFNDCIVFTNMSQPGDSGSIIFDMEMYALGLLFAGSPKATIASPMQTIMDFYGLTILQ